MSSTNLGRVQGAGVFYSSATTGTSISISTLKPSNIKPLVGDSVLFNNGDVRNVTAVTSTTVTCGAVVSNIKGEQGVQGIQGVAGTNVSFTYNATTNTRTIMEV